MTDLHLFLNALRELVRPAKLAAAILLAGLGVLLAVLARASADAGTFDPQATFNAISSVLIFAYMVTILSLVLATGLIGQEVEAKTIPYLLTRPVPRWRILLAKYAAAVVVTTLAVWFADTAIALTLFPITKIGTSHLWKDLLILPVAVMTYSGVFMLLGSLFKRALLIGLGYAVLEPLLPYLPGDFKLVSLLTYLHVLAPHLNDADSAIVTQAAPDTAVASWVAWTVISAVIGASVVLALSVFSVREYTPLEDRA